MKKLPVILLFAVMILILLWALWPLDQWIEFGDQFQYTAELYAGNKTFSGNPFLPVRFVV